MRDHESVRTPARVWADLLADLERLEEEVERRRLEPRLGRGGGLGVGVARVGLLDQRDGKLAVGGAVPAVVAVVVVPTVPRGADGGQLR